MTTSSSASSAENRRLIVMLVVGALVLAAGLLLARVWLPEWQDERWQPERTFPERYREIARQAGIRLQPGEPRVVLSSDDDSGFHETWEAAGGSRTGRPPTPVRVSVAHQGALPGRPQVKGFEVSFTPSGRPVSMKWSLSGLEIVTPTGDSSVPPAVIHSLRALLLRPGEKLGPPQKGSVSGSEVTCYDIVGTSIPEYLAVVAPPGGKVQVGRQSGSAARSLADTERFWSGLFLRGIPRVVLFLAVVGLFVVLLSKGRIDLVNGALLAALAFAVSAATLAQDPGVGGLVDALLLAVWVFLLWSAGESFLRSIDPDFTTSLDALRAGKLGPRGGRSLLYGVALGALLAGLKLAVRAASMAAPGAWPIGLSVPLPIFSTSQSPVADGIALAAKVMFLLAFAMRPLHRRWAGLAAALAGALFCAPLRLHPVWAGFLASFALFYLLVWIYRRYGLTALLTTGVTSLLLPATAFSTLHADWLPAVLTVSAALSAGLVALGFVGLSRPERVELERLAPPRFIRRLEEERRVKYEMDLLARMQLGLLPADVPAVPGWDIAARSLLATEAGGDLYDFILDDSGHLWIAAGDVAGHGYSCSIVQAMTTAALTSLIGPGKSPSEVLVGVDRVIRRGGTRRNFTSLTLLRIDPETGEAVLANAGHPYPLALADGEVAELAVPGLPLGQGPHRQYLDIPLQIPAGGALVLCSDGLFEAVNWESSPYGFDRPREVLRTLETRAAAEILEVLLEDWKSHVRSEAPPDDTTIVVIKRAATFDRSITVA